MSNILSIDDILKIPLSIGTGFESGKARIAARRDNALKTFATIAFGDWVASQCVNRGEDSPHHVIRDHQHVATLRGSTDVKVRARCKRLLTDIRPAVVCAPFKNPRGYYTFTKKCILSFTGLIPIDIDDKKLNKQRDCPAEIWNVNPLIVLPSSSRKGWHAMAYCEEARSCRTVNEWKKLYQTLMEQAKLWGVCDQQLASPIQAYFASFEPLGSDLLYINPRILQHETFTAADRTKYNSRTAAR
jgi:hypothetical protein